MLRYRPFPGSIAYLGSDLAGSGHGRGSGGVPVSEAWPQGGLDIGEFGGFGFNVKAAQVGDAVIANVYNQSLSGRTGPSCTSGDLALMYLMRRGAWRATPPGRQDELVAFPAGSFIVCATSARPACGAPAMPCSSWPGGC